jgi:hypothetical protein
MNNVVWSPPVSMRRPSERRSGSFENVHEQRAAEHSRSGKLGASFERNRLP